MFPAVVPTTHFPMRLALWVALALIEPTLAAVPVLGMDDNGSAIAPHPHHQDRDREEAGHRFTRIDGLTEIWPIQIPMSKT